MIADAAYRVGDFPRARAALERLAADANGEAERLRALDMRARVDWAASRRTGAAWPATRPDAVAHRACARGTGSTECTRARITGRRRRA